MSHASLPEMPDSTLYWWLDHLPYFHGKVSVAKVQSMLQNEGDFLIQAIEQASNCKTKELIKGSLLVLSVMCNKDGQVGKIRHWLIKQEENKFGIEHAIFPSIPTMISSFLTSESSVVEGEMVRISNPIVREDVVQPKEDNNPNVSVPKGPIETIVIGDKEADGEVGEVLRSDKVSSSLDAFVSGEQSGASNEDDAAEQDQYEDIQIEDENGDAEQEQYEDVEIGGEKFENDGFSGGAAAGKSSSQDLNASFFFNIGTSDKEGSSTIVLDEKNDLGSVSADRIASEESRGILRAYNSAPTPGEWPVSTASAPDIKLSKKDSALSLSKKDSNPSLPLSPVMRSECAFVLHSSGLQNPLETMNSIAQDKSASTTSIEVNPSKAGCIHRAPTPYNGSEKKAFGSKVSFCLPSDCSNKSSAPRCSFVKSRCSSCMSTLASPMVSDVRGYNSVDKLPLCYSIAKASSFYEFVQLYCTAKGMEPSVSTMIHLAELLFLEYHQHVLDGQRSA